MKKIYRTQEEVEEDIKDGVLTIEGDVEFQCPISITASIEAEDIIAWDIKAKDITARDIDAWGIKSENVKAKEIDAWGVEVEGIVEALDITAGDIIANDIIANNINYWAFCIAYNSIKCKNWEARRYNHKEPICLDGKLIIK